MTKEYPIFGAAPSALKTRLAKTVSALLATTCLATANAAPVTWHLKNVTAGAGAKAIGSFDYDADTNTYSNIEIDDSGYFKYYSLVPDSNPTNDLVRFIVDPCDDLTGRRFLALELAAVLTNSRGGVDILPNAKTDQASTAASVTRTTLIALMP